MKQEFTCYDQLFQSLQSTNVSCTAYSDPTPALLPFSQFEVVPQRHDLYEGD